MAKKSNPVRAGGPIDTLLARLRHGTAYRKLKPHMPLKCCLDIGSGAYPAFLVGLPAQQKYGLEQSISKEQQDEALSLNIRLVECDLSDSAALRFNDDFFDVVTMLAVIEHITPDKVPSLLLQVHRVLRPGGVLFLTTPAAWTDRLLRTMAACRLISRREIEDHKDTFTSQKLVNCLTQAGFGQIQTGAFEMWMNLWALARK